MNDIYSSIPSDPITRRASTNWSIGLKKKRTKFKEEKNYIDFDFYTSQFEYVPPTGSRRWRELFSIASVNEFIIYSFKFEILNGGGTSNFRSRSILKLNIQ